MDSTKLWHVLSFYLSIAVAIFRFTLHSFLNLNRISFLVNLMDTLLSLYFRLCGLSPCTIDLDSQTTMHFWTTVHRRFNKPSLVLLHGYGGNSLWQFLFQVAPLSRKFNLYVPDLLFFGKSNSKRLDRSDYFQARCVAEGVKCLGLTRFSVYSISYGGYVAFRMAEMYPDAVEKVVIVSSGIGCTDLQMGKYIKKIGRDVSEILLPKHPSDLRLLVNLSMHKPQFINWAPEFLLREFINVFYTDRRQEKLELLEHLLGKQADANLPVLTQETLIIWGDKDRVFPVELGHQLQRHLEPKSRLVIIKDTGHAANIESFDAVTSLIVPFFSGCS